MDFITASPYPLNKDKQKVTLRETDKNRTSMYLPANIQQALKLLVSRKVYGSNRSQVISYLVQQQINRIKKKEK